MFVKYPSLYEPNPYLADEVKVEVGVRSKTEPFTSMTVQSLLHEYFPNPAYAETPFAVQVVEPHKTFLEKAFLLHEEFKKPSIEKVRAERMSRHLYDLEKIMDTDTGTNDLWRIHQFQRPSCQANYPASEIQGFGLRLTDPLCEKP